MLTSTISETHINPILTSVAQYLLTFASIYIYIYKVLLTYALKVYASKPS